MKVASYHRKVKARLEKWWFLNDHTVGKAMIESEKVFFPKLSFSIVWMKLVLKCTCRTSQILNKMIIKTINQNVLREISITYFISYLTLAYQYIFQVGASQRTAFIQFIPSELVCIINKNKIVLERYDTFFVYGRLSFMYKICPWWITYFWIFAV